MTYCSRHSAWIFGLFLLAGLDACKSTGASQGPMDCGVIEPLPPIVTVVSATTGAPICDATFAVVGWPDGGPTPPDGGGASACGTTQNLGCPDAGAPSDGATAECRYALLGLRTTPPSAYTIEISSAGFASATAHVNSGVGLCQDIPASQITVMLSPVANDATAGAQ
jgi:hypothetical protein